MTKVIALDCGHGFNTAGKRTPDGIREWTINDLIRKRVVHYLSEYDVTIIHTDGNEGGTDEVLSKRKTMYVNAKAAAFVSIHCNAFKGVWGTHGGTEVFTDKTPTAADKKLADAIYPKMVKYSGLKGRGIKQEDFYVINQNSIPAVLIECGFMDSTTDHPVITSARGQDAFGKAIAEGLIEFLALKKKTIPQIVATFKPYTIKVDGIKKGDVLNIRVQPNVTSKVTGSLKYNDPSKYTIVEEKDGWGKLKSGKGWINLYYTKKA